MGGCELQTKACTLLPCEHWIKMVDEKTTTGVLDPAYTLRVVRSHRAPRDYSLKSACALLLIIGILASLLTTSVLPLEQTRRAPVSPTVAQPLAFPALPPVGAPTAVSEPQATPPDRHPEDERASRSQATAKPDLSRVEKVISFALAQQGDPYVFAASGPNSWDCSGLVMGAFAVVGVKLPHYTGTMLNYGKSVSRANMIRGDIVFLSYNHVAIYLGNNQMVAASSGKGRVTVQTVYGFYAARRLL